MPKTIGKDDNSTIAKISVAIKYTSEFANSLGVPIKSGMFQVALWTMRVEL